MSLHERLAVLAAGEKSNWLSDAQFRKDNSPWLEHSQNIALKILRVLREKKMSQKNLAELIGVSPQQVSKVVKGSENLTLETIASIEKALCVSLIKVQKEDNCYFSRIALEYKKTNNADSVYIGSNWQKSIIKNDMSSFHSELVDSCIQEPSKYKAA